jgi:hypothetical protein
VETRWRFDDREALASVLKIEFSAKVAERAVAEVVRDNETLSRFGDGGGVTLPVGYRVHTRFKPTGLVLPHSSSSASADSSGSTSPRIP